VARALVVEIIGDSRNLQKNLGSATKATKGFELSLKSLAKTVGVVFGAATVVHGLEDIIGKAMESEVSMAKLNAAFKSSGVSMRQYATEVDRAQAAGRRLGFSNIDTQAGLAKLVVATQSGSLAIKDLATAEDLARFKHITLAQSSQMLSQAMTGSARAVKQLGINVVPVTTNLNALREAHKAAGTKATEQEIATAKLADKQATGAKIIEIVTQRLHGQADAYASTTSGAMARFRAALEDLEERIGQKLLPTMTKWANYLTDHLPQIEKFLKGLADKAQTLWSAVQKLVDITGGWRSVLLGLVGLKLVSMFTAWQGGLKGLIGASGGGGLVGADAAALSLGGRLKNLARFGAIGISIPVWINIGTHFIGDNTKDLVTTLLKYGLPQFIPAALIAKGAQNIFSGNQTMSPAQAKAQFIKEAMKNGMTRKEAEAEYNRRAKGGSSVNAGGKAGSKRGIGGAGSVYSGASVEPAFSHPSTHPTRGLSGYPAFDYMVKAGTAVKAPEDGYIVGHSGSRPTGHPADVYGYSLYFYGVETHSMYFMTHLSDAAGDGYYPKGSVIGFVADQGKGSHVHVGVNKGSGRLATPDRAPGGTGRLAGTHGFKSAAAAALGSAVGVDPFAALGGSGGGSSGGRVAGKPGKPAAPIFGAVGKQIADDVTSATTHIATSLDKMMKMIIAKQAALAAAIARMRAAVSSAFQDFASQAMSAFDAINNAWKSPSALKLQKMQAEDTAKAAARAYADAVEQYGVNSPEALEAARAWEESQLEAQAQAEQEAHDKKVKADRDAFEKRLAELQKQAGSAKTRAQAAKIQKEINALFSEYGITQDSLQAATDWQTAQSLFVGAIGNLKKSLDALTAAIDKSPRPSPGTSNPGASTPGPGLASGGFLAGAEGQGIPILAHANEFVLQSSATRKIGIPALAYMNRTGNLPRYDEGGVVHPWQLDDAYMDPGYRDKLMEAERQAKLKYGGSSIFNPKNWTPDIVNTAGKYHDMLTRRYGDLIHFEDGWIPEIYLSVQKAAGIIESALTDPPDNIWNRTHGTVWYDQGRGRKAAIPSRLGKYGYGTGSWGSGVTPARLEDIASGYIPSFAMGGVMPHTGLAYVHQGETISRAGAGPTTIILQVDRQVLGKIVTDEVVAAGGRGGPLQARLP